MKKDSVIFLLERNQEDIYHLKKAFFQAGITNLLKVARHDDEAILYLRGVGVYSDRSQYPLPSLMLLDLSCSPEGGFRVLKWVREQPDYSRLPVVVLVGLHQARELQRGLDMGANAYLVKRSELDDLIKLTRSIEFLEEIFGKSRQKKTEIVLEPQS